MQSYEDAALTDALVDAACERAERAHEEGAPVFESLAVLVSAAESASNHETVSSILVLDKDGLLRNGASPNLPRDYLDAIDRLRPHPRLGTCAAAAATGEVVLTPDFRADEKWAELRHLPLSLGFAGAWSMPIKDRQGLVLGTFGTYFRQSRVPTVQERRNVEKLAGAAAKVLAPRAGA
jgi:GAF domain-containing protein